MKPQYLSLESEALEEFVKTMNAALEMTVRNLKERKLTKGSVSGKIEITMLETTNAETGEVVINMELTPDVKMKIATGASLKCGTKAGLIMRQDENGRPLIMSRQIGMDEIQKGA